MPINETWTDIIFANNWLIREKYNCAEYRQLLQDNGITDKQVKNTHYRVINLKCGIETFMERTTIKRNMDNGTSCLSKCRGCKAGEKKDNSCYYQTALRDKKLTKIPERDEKVKVGDVVGTWVLLEIKPSVNYSDHQRRVICQCLKCKEIKEVRYDGFFENTIACDCYRNRSIGETLINDYLIKKGYNYKSEYTFDTLVGVGGGLLRYDFAIMSDNNEPIMLIEFDGEQHFQEAGSYFNSAGKLQIHDNIKNKFAAEQQIPLLRISYLDIKNIYDILDKELSF